MASSLRSLALVAAAALALSGCAATAPSTSGSSGPAGTQSGAPTGSSATAPSPAGSPAAPVATATQRSYRAADGSCTLPERLLNKDHESLGTTEKKIALTFDGGAGVNGADRILQTLEEKGATASFFFTGQFAEKNPDLVRRIAAKYPVGNHSWNHPGFASKKLSDAEIASQLSRAEAAIEQASGGVNPQPFFRYPEGDRNAATTVQVNKACYLPIRWSIDTKGWVGTVGSGNIPAQSVAKVISSVVDAPASKKNGGIVLMHVGEASGDGSTLDADALPAMIDGLKAQGYTFVTLEEMLVER
nr:polysaccharide deacetylase family protein [Propionibacterium sp.]